MCVCVCIYIYIYIYIFIYMYMYICAYICIYARCQHPTGCLRQPFFGAPGTRKVRAFLCGSSLV